MSKQNRPRTLVEFIEQQDDEFFDKFNTYYGDIGGTTKLVEPSVKSVQSYINRVRIQLVEWIIAEYGYMNDGCGCCGANTLKDDLNSELNDIK